MRSFEYAFRQGGASLWRSRGSSAFAVLAIALVLAASGRPSPVTLLHAVGVAWIAACTAALAQALLGHRPLQASILTSVIVAGLTVWAVGASYAVVVWRRRMAV